MKNGAYIEKDSVAISSVGEKISSGNREMYTRLLEYVKSHKSIGYDVFDAALMGELCLFNVPDDEYLKDVEAHLDMIIKALPSFKRIFSRPIIRLKDERHIVPIETVKVIDKSSLTHVAGRSELWENVTSEGIKPRKLMTLEHVETYSIYENIVFAYAVDSVLSYIKHTLVRIKDVVYGCRDIHFNLLDRTHHNLYFLAVGKLYLEYVSLRASEESWSRCIDKMMFIDKSLRAKLNSPVYRHCKRKSYALKLKKTNIFRSHKDYAEVFKTIRLLCAGGEMSLVDDSEVHSQDEEYKAFCKLISLFAIGHFNYKFDKKSKISFDPFKASASFLDWTLVVSQYGFGGLEGLKFTTRKDKEYTTCMLFSERGDVSGAEMEAFKQHCGADEYLWCSPSLYGDAATVYLSVFDIDSFRRIQQILSRGMIMADEQRETCHFCGGRLETQGHRSICRGCKAEIAELECTETGKKYRVSGIVNVKESYNKGEMEKRRFLHDRLDEAQLHFRNITPITHYGDPICPHCNRVHMGKVFIE